MKLPNTYIHFFLAIVFSGIFLTSCQKNDRALVVGKIQDASDLATTEFVIDKIVYGSKTKKFFGLKLNETNFLAYSQAVVKTGIDLSKISEKDVQIDGSKIFLQLPPIEVINFSYPPDRFYQDSLISAQRKIFNKISIYDQEEFFRLAELDIRANLQYMGIVPTTQNHTRQMFRALLGSLGFEEVYITFENDNLVISKVNLLEDRDKMVEQ